MIDRTSAEEEISRAINSAMGYTMNATEYFNGLDNGSFTSTVAGATASKPMGRGRGVVDVSHSRLEEIRLAARISRLQAQNYPMGHLPTTREILAGDRAAEITAGLRTLGIHSTDSQLSSRTTIPTVVKEKIRVDGKVPLILDGDLFHQRYCSEEEDEDDESQSASPKPSENMKYDPSKPLTVLFPTIVEFRQPIPDPESSGSELNTSVTSSASSSSSKNSSRRGKKKKWTKVPVDMVLSSSKHIGREDGDVVCGGPPLPPHSSYRSRTVYSAEGMRNIK
uniref:Uncharacterized protein n=2 Tax=gambiae species complex TaxID=44542 RepID=A0A8W7PZR4_ANOCL